MHESAVEANDCGTREWRGSKMNFEGTAKEKKKKTEELIKSAKIVRDILNSSNHPVYASLRRRKSLLNFSLSI